MLTEKVFVIAELAQSYEGSFTDAEKLIRAAAGTGAQAVKFQVFSADELATHDYTHYALYRKLEFSPAQWSDLFGLAETLGMRAFADVFGLESIPMLLDAGAAAFKIHSADMQNLPLLQAVATSGKLVILSCGGSEISEISEAFYETKRAGASSICLMHGFQASPTTPEDTAFAKMRNLRSTFNVPVGFADHIAGDHPLSLQWPLIAVAAGARVIEKHMTLHRADQKEDYISALNPGEFKQMVEWIRLVEAAEAGPGDVMNAAEAGYRLESRKRVVATRDLSTGTRLASLDIGLKRVAEESEVFDPRQVLGRVLSRPVSRDAVITEASLESHQQRPRLVATLACRNTSSRLYAKPLQRIGDRTILEYLVARIRSVPCVDQIVLAISEGDENAAFLEHARQLGLDCIFGDQQDVQNRLILAGERGNADVLLRATTESPFLYTDNIPWLFEQHIKQKAALTVCEGLPEGSYCELIDLAALKDAHERGERRHRSELCSLYLVENPDRYKILRFQAPESVRRPALRLTVDYPEDLIVCREIANELGKNGPLFSLESVIEFMDARPRLNEVNSWIDAGQGRIWN
jgi:N,N'-diacetyllegionaminate synthase